MPDETKLDIDYCSGSDAIASWHTILAPGCCLNDMQCILSRSVELSTE